jgi:hypothetical protein
VNDAAANGGNQAGTSKSLTRIRPPLAAAQTRDRVTESSDRRAIPWRRAQRAPAAVLQDRAGCRDLRPVSIVQFGGTAATPTAHSRGRRSRPEVCLKPAGPIVCEWPA